MINSIKYFEEECINKFENLENEFMKEPEKMAEYVLGLTKELYNLGLRMIQESLEDMNQMLIESPIRRRSWVIESHETKRLITSLGEVQFKKTLFTNKETGKSEYLLDRMLGLKRNERITEDALAKMLEESVQTSYRRGGEETSILSEVTKQAVKNKIHALEFPKVITEHENEKKEKKVVTYLYIEADEDHASLQYQKRKGDLVKSKNNRKNNCLLTKLVYVHEGIEHEKPNSKRMKLINPHYFASISAEKENKIFWDEIYEYIDTTYDLDQVKKVYINSDGGRWIKAGMHRIGGVTHVLDGFHLEKYITKLTSHMEDSRWDVSSEMRKIIRYKKKEDFNALVDLLEFYQEEKSENKAKLRSGLQRMEDAREYLLANWTAAKLRLSNNEGVIGSSTEGHVSHVLSKRMSSRPMGWSKKGASNVAQLCVYDKNGGDMLELVRYQKRKIAKAAGAEYEVISCEQMLRAERNRHGVLGKYTDIISHSLTRDSKKRTYFKSHIWLL